MPPANRAVMRRRWREWESCAFQRLPPDGANNWTALYYGSTPVQLTRLLASAVAIVTLTACSQDSRSAGTQGSVVPRYMTRDGTSGASLVNLYAATGVGALSPVAARAKPLVYVPNSRSGSVTVIDPVTHRVLRTFSTGKLPQHVVPSYDMRTLWVTNDEGNSLTAIDPVTGVEGEHVPVDDPYNM